MEVSALTLALLWIFAVYGFANAVQRTSASFAKDSLRNWWEFWEWYEENRPKQQQPLMNKVGDD